jgi:Flp pilus assembly protein TadD
MSDKPPPPASGRPGSGRPTGGRSAGGRPIGARSAGSQSASSGSGSLYERYKDALRRGHVAALRGRNDAAIDAYGEAASIAPDRALPHASIGGIFVKMGRLDEAITAYDRALGLGPRDESALRGIAEAFARAGRRTEAAGALDRLAEILDGGGRLADATDTARRALELAESRVRRRQVESLATRLRASSPGDEAAQRALDQALRVLEPAEPAPAAIAPEAVAPEAAPEAGAEPKPVAEAEPEPDTEAPPEPEPTPEVEAEAEAPAEPQPEPEPEVEPAPEPAGLGIALGAAAELALYQGDLASARDGLLAAARAHRRAGRLVAGVDACYLAMSIAPGDPELHLLLVEIYLDRGWRSQAADKLLLLGRLADLDADAALRDALCRLVTERLSDEPRVAELCA